MNLIPWRNSEKKSSTTEIAIVNETKNDEIIIYPNKNAISKRSGGISVRSKSLKISGKDYDIDPHQLMRMIRQVTQTIGEYKNRDNPYASYVIGALRKARSDMVSDLEHHFHIHWEIDESNGRCTFYL